MSNELLVGMIKKMEATNSLDTFNVSLAILDKVATTNVKNLSTYCAELDADCKIDNVKGYSKSYMVGFAGIVEVLNKKFNVTSDEIGVFSAFEIWSGLWSQMGKRGVFLGQKILKSATKVELIEYHLNGLDDKKAGDKEERETSSVNRIERELFALLLESMPLNMRETASVLAKTKGIVKDVDGKIVITHTELTADEYAMMPNHCQELYSTLGIEFITEVITS